MLVLHWYQSVNQSIYQAILFIVKKDVIYIKTATTDKRELYTFVCP